MKKKKLITTALVILLVIIFISSVFREQSPSKLIYGASLDSTSVGSTNIDTYAQSNYPNTPPGNQFNLYVGTDRLNGTYNKGVTRIFIKFNLPALPAGAVIDTMRVEMYQYTWGASSSYGVTAHTLTCAWGEYDVTWNNQPTCLGSSAGSATIGLTTGWKSIDITSLGRQWYNGSVPNHGIRIRANNESAYGGVFYSRDCTHQCNDGAYKPRLIVDYHVPPPPPTETLPPTITPTITPTPSSPIDNHKPWTFMLYLAGDNDLSQALKSSISQIEAQFPNPNVNVVVLFDGNQMNDTYKFLVQPDGNYSLNENKWFLGELNTGNRDTLVDFAVWAMEKYPADHYYLSIANHGRGTQGVAWDVSSNKDHLSPEDIESALNIITNNGKWKIDILHYDTCLMALLENFYQVKDYVNYVIASQNLSWALFAYDMYSTTERDGGSHPPYQYSSVVSRVDNSTNVEQLVYNIVEDYFYHPLIQDYPRTISAVDTSKAVAVRQALDHLSIILRNNLHNNKVFIENTRFIVQKFDSRDYFRITQKDEYVDLYHLAERLQVYIDDETIRNATQNLMDAIEDMVIIEHHQSGFYGNNPRVYWDLDNSHGISIYFPPNSGTRDYKKYMDHSLFTFTYESKWNDFLADYFGLLGLPPETEDFPELPPMLHPPNYFYLPLITR